MLIAITGDIQAENYRQYSKILPDGMSSRLADIKSVLQQMLDYCIQNKVSVFVINGDIFEFRDNIDVMVYLMVYRALELFKAAGIRLYINLGNHDMLQEGGDDFALYPFSNIADGINKTYAACTLTLGDGKVFTMGFVAYSDSPQTLRDNIQKMVDKKCDILFAHCGVDEARVGPNDSVVKGQLSVRDLQANHFDQVFLGHYHSPQQIAKNTWYAGCPLQLNWGDRDDHRGFLVYDTETKQTQLIPTTFPWFIDRGLEDVASMDLTGHFVKVRIANENKLEIYNKVMAAGAQWCTVVSGEAQKVEKRMDVDMSTDEKDMIKEYVKHMPAQDLDKDLLLSLGMEIYGEIK